jgi:hypothetical protein
MRYQAHWFSPVPIHSERLQMRRVSFKLSFSCAVVASLWAAAVPSLAVTIDMVTVGNLGNANDTGSQGGDLILCRPKSGQPLRMYQREVDAGSLEEFQRIRYGRSVLVLFLNGPRSVHAVSPRQPTPHTRRFLNLIGQAPRPLFDVTQYQMPRWLYLARLFRNRYIDPSEFGFGEQRL